MENEKNLVINILRCSLNSKKYYKSTKNINWVNFVSEIGSHKISSLIYSTLDRHLLNSIDKGVVNEWKKEVLLSNLNQVKHINQISYLLNEMKREGIEVVILKGLVLRQLYSIPETRTMNDADILVKESDYSKAKQCLINLGYRNDKHNNDIHEGFVKEGCFEVELHRKLVNSEFISCDFCDFEDKLWERAFCFDINNVNTNVLNNEDTVLYLCMHMAVHLKSTGFGLRQLYDLTLFLKVNRNNIKWNELEYMLLKYKLQKFFYIILLIIKNIFEFDFLSELNQKYDIDKIVFKNLKESIINNGVYGKKNLNSDFRELYVSYDKHRDTTSNIRKLIRFLFPSREKMIKEYKYTIESQKEVMLIKAWYCRIIKLIKYYGVINLISQIKNALAIRKLRINLIKELEIPY